MKQMESLPAKVFAQALTAPATTISLISSISLLPGVHARPVRCKGDCEATKRGCNKCRKEHRNKGHEQLDLGFPLERITQASDTWRCTTVVLRTQSVRPNYTPGGLGRLTSRVKGSNEPQWYSSCTNILRSAQVDPAIDL